MSRGPSGRSRWQRSQWQRLVSDAALSVAARPGRTAIMLAGILIGVALATATVLVAEAQQLQIDLRFDAQRSPVAVVQDRSARDGIFDPEHTAPLGALDVVEAEGEFSTWRDEIAVSAGPYSAVSQRPLLAGTSGGFEAAGIESVAGVPLTMADVLPAAPLVWVGAQLADELGVEGSGPVTIDIDGRAYSVAGVVSADGGFSYVNNSVLLSSQRAGADLGPGSTVRWIAGVRPGSATVVTEQALALLDPSRQADLINATQPDGELLRGTVIGDLKRIGLALSAFTSFVGMLAVANTLSMSINQRSREFGLRTAIGWSRRWIATLVICEAMIAGAIAAVFGATVGVVGSLLWIAVRQGWELVVPPFLLPSAILLGVVASVLGALIPALRASSLSPLEAMRS